MEGDEASICPAATAYRTGAKEIEKAFPHIVEMIVSLRGFGKKLDEMYEWHRARGIHDLRGRSRRDVDGRDYIRWCFVDPAVAAEFAKEFGGKLNG
jgi:hypothetical protein